MVINIQIKNRVATYIPGDALPVCGNAGDTVKFSFDSEWAAHTTKTARFIWGGNKFHEEEFTGDTCPVPVFLNTDCVLIGVFSSGDGQLASTKAEVPYRLSVRCGGARPDAMSAEAYTHEAKEAAELAAQSAVEAENYANNAATQASIARTGAALTLNYSERAEEVVYALERKNIEGQIRSHSWRLVALENHLGLVSSIQTVFENTASVEVPSGAMQYAKIDTLVCGGLTNAWSDGWYGQGVTAIRVLDEEEICLRRYALAVQNLPDYGEGKSIDMYDSSEYFDPDHYNKIVFKNGRAYYHHNVYSVLRGDSYGEDYEKRNPGDTIAGEYSYQVLLRPEEPEVIDITDSLGFDGFVDLSGAASLAFELVEPEDGWHNESGDIQNWYPAYVGVSFEVNV